MLFDAATQVDETRADLSVLRYTLWLLEGHDERWCRGYGWGGEDRPHCVVGWLNLVIGGSNAGPAAEPGNAMAARCLFPALPWYRRIGRSDEDEVVVMRFNDQCGPRAVCRLLKRAIRRLDAGLEGF